MFGEGSGGFACPLTLAVVVGAFISLGFTVSWRDFLTELGLCALLRAQAELKQFQICLGSQAPSTSLPWWEPPALISNSFPL